MSDIAIHLDSDIVKHLECVSDTAIDLENIYDSAIIALSDTFSMYMTPPVRSLYL